MGKQDDITDITSCRSLVVEDTCMYHICLCNYIRYEYIDCIRSSNAHITNVDSNNIPFPTVQTLTYDGYSV